MQSYDDIYAELRDLQSRLDDLEGAAQSGNSSVIEGNIGFFEDTQNPGDSPRVEIGQHSDGSYGVIVRDAQGRIAFRADEHGLREPRITLPHYRADATPVTKTSSNSDHVAPFSASGTTAATNQNTYETFVSAPSHDAIVMQCVVFIDAGVVAEFRLGFQAADDLVDFHTDKITSAPGTGTFHTLFVGWKPPRWRDPAYNQTFVVQLEARIDSGVGNLFVYPPKVLGLVASVEDNLTSSGILTLT